MLHDALVSFRVVMVTVVVCCVAYPLGVLVAAMIVAPNAREGGLVRDKTGRIRGSVQIAQGFARPEHFWPRPSAVNYDAAAAGGSNLSPTSELLRKRAVTTLARFQRPSNELVPADLVAASASGLDPHITLAAARFQARRVAAARNMPLNDVLGLIDQVAERMLPGSPGAEGIVNVLRLNLALNKMNALP